jgi:hypothetical protein
LNHVNLSSGDGDGSCNSQTNNIGSNALH